MSMIFWKAFGSLNFPESWSSENNGIKKKMAVKPVPSFLRGYKLWVISWGFLVPIDVLGLCVVSEVNKWILERLGIYILVAIRVPDEFNGNSTIILGLKWAPLGVHR